MKVSPGKTPRKGSDGSRTFRYGHELRRRHAAAEHAGHDLRAVRRRRLRVERMESVGRRAAIDPAGRSRPRQPCQENRGRRARASERRVHDHDRAAKKGHCDQAAGTDPHHEGSGDRAAGGLGAADAGRLEHGRRRRERGGPPDGDSRGGAHEAVSGAGPGSRGRCGIAGSRR